MKMRNLVLSASIACAGLSAALVAPSAMAQAKEQFFPSLVYRTGAYAPNGVPFANGYADRKMFTADTTAGSVLLRNGFPSNHM